MESKAALTRIFKMFDLKNKGVIDKDGIKTVMKGLQLYPSAQEVKDIIAKVDQKGNGVVDFREFCEMRLADDPVTLNVLAEFKKFDVDFLHRGFITEDSIRRVLKAEGHDREHIENFVHDFMSCDSNNDGKVSFKDLYERMMGQVPEEWLDWIYENVNRGVADNTILDILEENGFKRAVALNLLRRTKKEGKQSSEVSYVHSSPHKVYTVRS